MPPETPLRYYIHAPLSTPLSKIFLGPKTCKNPNDFACFRPPRPLPAKNYFCPVA